MMALEMMHKSRNRVKPAKGLLPTPVIVTTAMSTCIREMSNLVTVWITMRRSN